MNLSRFVRHNYMDLLGWEKAKGPPAIISIQAWNDLHTIYIRRKQSRDETTGTPIARRYPRVFPID